LENSKSMFSLKLVKLKLKIENKTEKKMEKGEKKAYLFVPTTFTGPNHSPYVGMAVGKVPSGRTKPYPYPLGKN
jgi:hypothetical protein